MRRYLISSLLALSVIPCYARTASQLISDARLMAFDKAFTENVINTDTQVLRLLNEGQDDVLKATLCMRRAYVFDTSSGTVYYALPADFMQIDRVLADDWRLEEKSPAKLDQASTEWESITGEPINFYVNFSSRTRIGFHPYPVTNTTTETVKVEYYAQAFDMALSSAPFNNIVEFEPFHEMLAYYAAARMLYAQNMAADGDRYMQRYLIDRAAFNEYCRARPGYFPSAGVAPVR